MEQTTDENEEYHVPADLRCYYDLSTYWNASQPGQNKHIDAINSDFQDHDSINHRHLLGGILSEIFNSLRNRFIPTEKRFQWYDGAITSLLPKSRIKILDIV